MARSTGPVLVAGGLAMANETLLKPGASLQDVPWRLVPVTAGLALGLALLEKAAPEFAVGLAWLLVAGVIVFPPTNGPSILGNLNKRLRL